MKKLMLDLNIPYMERKWNIIDENYKTFYEKSNERKEEYNKLINQNKNLTSKELQLKLNVTKGVISKYKKLYEQSIR